MRQLASAVTSTRSVRKPAARNAFGKRQPIVHAAADRAMTAASLVSVAIDHDQLTARGRVCRVIRAAHPAERKKPEQHENGSAESSNCSENVRTS